MRHLPAAALLIASLAACEAGGDAAGPEARASATDATVVSGQPAEPSTARTAPTSAQAMARDTACGADQLGRWLNALPTEQVKAAIAAAVGERPIRYYTQGDPITMDFSEARLNVEFGKDGRIKLFRCG
jgi:hypothetical protein